VRRAIGIALLLAALGGCRQEAEKLPAACTNAPESVERALRRAPAQVTIDGTRLSSCFTEGADADNLQLVGATFTRVAADLAYAARRDDDAALRLGYLVGAVRRGAADTANAHTELVRRIEQEASTVDGPAFRRGLAAGRASG
jgi:hypothetical protein